MTQSARAAGEPLSADGPIGAFLRDLHAKITPNRAGAVADYIPELAKADPAHFAIAVATVDGKVYAAGDADVMFTIQSVSKPFMYGLALETLGREAVLKHVGVEPTGAAFNAAVFDEANNRPSNPMVNAGAIGVAALVKGKTYAARRRAMVDLFAKYAGRAATIDEAVFQSERDTGDRNRAIAAMMYEAGMLKGDVEAILDLYFSQCSVLVNCRDLAVMGAALANDGAHPLTGERVLAQDYVPDLLTVMHSCGMYNYAGQWSFEVGIPAKSGVSGSIVGVVPGQMGFAAYSPRLDAVGNSVRGIAAFKAIAEEFGLHAFRTPSKGVEVVRRELRGDAVRSKRRRTARERAVLTDSGEKICVIETQGALYLASAERLLRRIRAAADQSAYLILDMRRIYGADAAARRLLAMLIDEVNNGGPTLIFADVSRAGPMSELQEMIAGRAGIGEVLLFSDVDAALEWCENQLVRDAPLIFDKTSFSLAHLDLFRGLSAAELKSLEGLARPFEFQTGQHIVKEGDAAQLFFLIAQGVASVRLSLGGGDFVRIASMGPGSTVGDMALLDGGPRSADVVAEERVLCYGFSVDELKSLDNPVILQTILLNLGADLAERLRGANNEIRALKQ